MTMEVEKEPINTAVIDGKIFVFLFNDTNIMFSAAVTVEHGLFQLFFRFW